jgi:hypothetical protein
VYIASRRPARDQRFLRREVLVDRYELGGHQTAGRVRVVLQQALGLRLLRRLELGENVVGRFLVEFLECVGPLVRRHLGHERGRFDRRQLLEHHRAQLLVEILEHLAGPLLRQGREERAHHLLRQRLRNVREVGRVHFLRLRPDAFRVLLEQLEQVRNDQRRERPVYFRVRRHRRGAAVRRSS